MSFCCFSIFHAPQRRINDALFAATPAPTLFFFFFFDYRCFLSPLLTMPLFAAIICRCFFTAACHAYLRPRFIIFATLSASAADDADAFAAPPCHVLR